MLRYSLIAVWWLTVVASLVEWNGQSLALLQAGGIRSIPLAHGLIAAGVVLDAALALALMGWPRRISYQLSGVAVIALTLIATLLLPSLWLHPLLPLGKNLPILVILHILARRAS
ncbi:epimerase [Lysobacteraceae bacterium NML120232]|nr:epimerase [Xanthomonadaceae bacterium NML08-0793]PJK09793.1 epimerase [Xanthomonadaceae bacterium NML120232]